MPLYREAGKFGLFAPKTRVLAIGPLERARGVTGEYRLRRAYFAITPKYGYARLESELAHSINIYQIAVYR